MLSNKYAKLTAGILVTGALAVWGLLGLPGGALADPPDQDGNHNHGGGGGGGGQEPPRYTQVYLGTLGGLYSGANGINDSGQVVGEATTNAEDFHAFLLTPEDCDGDGNLDWFCDTDPEDGTNDLMLDLGTLPGYIYSSASGVNDSGQVVGWSAGNNVIHAFMWDSTIGMIDLGTLGGDLMNTANAINGAGQVVGLSTNANGDQRAFLVTPEDSDGDGVPDTWFRDDNGDGINDLMTDLGTLGGPNSDAVFINDSGQVVGSADTSATDKDGRFITRAFLITPEYDSDGNPVWFRHDDLDGTNDLMTDLGTLGGLRSSGAAMNDLGQIAGTGQINSNTYHAFLLTPEYDGLGNPVLWFRDSDGDGANDLMTDLGTLKGSNRSGWVAGLNNAAQVVGMSIRNPDNKPFLWENGQMKDLNELTDSDIDIVVWTGGINNAGQIVSGSGYILLPIP